MKLPFHVEVVASVQVQCHLEPLLELQIKRSFKLTSTLCWLYLYFSFTYRKRLPGAVPQPLPSAPLLLVLPRPVVGPGAVQPRGAAAHVAEDVRAKAGKDVPH